MVNKNFLIKNGFNPETAITFIPVCGNTYAIKETLKAAGFKFNRELGWHGPEQLELEGFFWLQFPFDHLYDASYEMRHNVKSMIKYQTNKILETNYAGTSEYVGEIGDRLKKIEVTVAGIHPYESMYGSGTAFSFDYDGQNLTWMTSSIQDVEVGDVITLSGTVKSHDFFKGEKVTYLTRCKIF